MTKQERADFARHFLSNDVIKDALSEMERKAVVEFMGAAKWWWGDRRRRIAAEHLREIHSFRTRLEMEILSGAPVRIKSIA